MDVGSYVVDGDDDNPDLAVVVDLPGVSIDEWTVTSPDGDERTVSEDNPDYDPDDSTVIVAFVESGLAQQWPEWSEADSANLHEGAQEHDVKLYSFPESRLTLVPDEEAAAMLGEIDMDALRSRLEDAGWDIDMTTEGVMIAEKMGEQYHITPSGEVDGDGQVRTPLENIVAEYSE